MWADVKARASRQWASLVASEASRPRRRSKAKAFRDRFPWMGPLIFWLSILYFAVQIFVSLVWRPSYSWSHNSISDLGNTSCGPSLCSPRHAWMNAEFFVLGFVMAAGSWLIFQEFTERDAGERLAARIGFSGLAIGGVGAALVGGFPENTVHAMHILGAGLAIGVGTAGIFVLGLALSLPHWKYLRLGMRVVPPIAVIALILFAWHVYLGIGAGTMERLGAYPETVWMIVFGTYISRDHRRHFSTA
jgi:hypothetical membrane protein